MIRTTDRDTDAGGRPPLPPILDPPGVDEGPMRRDLKRQIEALEKEIAGFQIDNCPYESFSASPVRGPAVLSNEELEEVRDELLEIRSELHDRVSQRAIERMDSELSAPLPAPGIIERLRRRLRGEG